MVKGLKVNRRYNRCIIRSLPSSACSDDCHVVGRRSGIGSRMVNALTYFGSGGMTDEGRKQAYFLCKN